MISPFGVTHTVAKTYLGGGKWLPVTKVPSFERKIAAKAKWHSTKPLKDRPMSRRKIPKKGYMDNIGQVRVLGLQGKKHVMIVDSKDQKRLVSRSRLGFRK